MDIAISSGAFENRTKWKGIVAVICGALTNFQRYWIELNGNHPTHSILKQCFTEEDARGMRIVMQHYIHGQPKLY